MSGIYGGAALGDTFVGQAILGNAVDEIPHNVITILLHDSLSFSDSILTILTPVTLNKLLSDSLSFSDSVAVQLFIILSINLSDKIEIFELLEDTFFAAARFQHIVDFPHNFFDSLQTTVTGTPMGMVDFFNFSDSIKQQLNIFLHLNDSIVISDLVVGVSSDKSPIFSDSLSFSDSIQTQLGVQLTAQLSDSLVFTDSLDQTPSTSFNSYIRRYLNDVT
jgi:hypothetical protein